MCLMVFRIAADGASSGAVLSDASTVELHHAERSPPPPAAPHARPAAPSPDPDPRTPHAAPSPNVLTPVADDGPPAPVLCDSPAGVLSRRGLLTPSPADSAVSEVGPGLGPGLGHAPAHPGDEAALTASEPRALEGSGRPCEEVLGRGLPERARATRSPRCGEHPRDEASVCLSAEAGMTEPGAARARTEAGAGTGAPPDAAAAAARDGAEAAAAVSAGLGASQATAPSAADSACAAQGPVPAAAGPAVHGPASPALDSGGSVGACAVQLVHGGAKPGGDGPPSDPELSPVPASIGGGCASAAGQQEAGAHDNGDPNPATLHDPVAPALGPAEPARPAADSSDPHKALVPLPGEDALVGGEPVTPPGLLAAMAACGTGGGSLDGAFCEKGLPEGATEPELPPLDSAGRREVRPQLFVDLQWSQHERTSGFPREIFVESCFWSAVNRTACWQI